MKIKMEIRKDSAEDEEINLNGYILLSNIGL